METPTKIRRQPAGSRVEQVTVSLPRELMEQLRKEAHREGITISKRVNDIIKATYTTKSEEAA